MLKQSYSKEQIMSKDLQTLSPDEWQSVSDYVVELSQRVTEASISPSDRAKDAGARLGPPSRKD